MNIFIVDQNPAEAARSLIDRHVIKMPSETCMMLANCYSKPLLEKAPLTKTGTVRGHGYPHHGCTKWAKSSYENFRWLLDHGLELCNEYTFRFGKTHFCETFIKWCYQYYPDEVLKVLPTKPYLAMPAQYKLDDVVSSYRAYYNGEKKFDKSGKWMYNWSVRQKPDWASI